MGWKRLCGYDHLLATDEVSLSETSLAVIKNCPKGTNFPRGNLGAWRKVLRLYIRNNVFKVLPVQENSEKNPAWWPPPETNQQTNKQTNKQTNNPKQLCVRWMPYLLEVDYKK